MIININKQFSVLRRAFHPHFRAILKSYQSHQRHHSILKNFNMSKIITVFGATGNQGGSVVTALLNDSQTSQEFKIRGVTRDTSKPAAQELAKRGVEVVTVRFHSTSLPKISMNTDSNSPG